MGNLKGVHSYALSVIFLLLFFPGLLFSAIDDEKELFSDQDSILTTITDLSRRLKKENKDEYILQDPTDDPMLRYYQGLVDDYLAFPRSYMDIIKNPHFEAMGYTVTFEDTMIVDPSFMPVVFNGKIFKEDPEFPQWENPYEKYTVGIKGLDTVRIFEKEALSDQLRWQAYTYFTQRHPEAVHYKISDLPDQVEKPEQLEVNVFKDLFKVENVPDFTHVGTPEKFVPDRKYWEYKFNHVIQFSYNYMSDNWHKGANKYGSIISDQQFEIHHKKEKITFNSLLRWKVNAHTVDEVHHDIKTSDDQLRSYSDFGIVAFNKKWSYSTNIEVTTQIFPVFKGDTTIRKSDILSPLTIKMGILGMKYSHSYTSKKDKNRNYKVDADISPLSVEYILVADKRVDPTLHKIEKEGERHRWDFGSKINSTLTYKFSKQINLTSRFMFFTNYERVEMELENNLNMIINRYLSVRLNSYLRFDDAGARGNWEYFQHSELISFGINYNWGGLK